ncbi:MAG: hypothetical protein WAT25_13290 [Paracoccaceae bacterium]
MAQVRHGAVWQGGGAGHGFGNQAAQAVGQGILRGTVMQVGGEAGEEANLVLAAGLQGEGDGGEKEEERQDGEEGEALAGVAIGNFRTPCERGMGGGLKTSSEENSRILKKFLR